MSAIHARRRPGRPISEADSQQGKREKILDAAEEAFAELGYAPTSLRKIADQAAVNPALIAYYFGTKERLFETVFKRRGILIAQRWMRMANRRPIRRRLSAGTIGLNQAFHLLFQLR